MKKLKRPDDWHPDGNGEWEISQFNIMACWIIKYYPKVQIELNTEDFTAIYLSLYASQGLIAEIFVNRSNEAIEKPVFRVFYGDPEVETHSTDYLSIMAVLDITKPKQTDLG